MAEPAAARVACDTDYAGRSLKGQLTQAGRIGARATVIVARDDGDDPAQPASRTSWFRSRTSRIRSRAMTPGATSSAAALRAERRRPSAHARRLGRARRDHGGLVFVDLRDERRRLPARRQPGARRRGGGGRARACGTSSSLRAEGEVVRARARGGQPEPADRRDRAAGRRARDRLALDRRCRSSSTRRASTRRSGFATAGSTCAASELQRNIRLRAKLVSTIRREMEAAGFVDIETPILGKPTPEGARDFLVPTRLQHGHASSRCRSRRRSTSSSSSSPASSATTRSPAASGTRISAPTALQEITQLDVEMAFPDQELIFALMERMIASGLARVRRRRARGAVPAADLGRGRPALRLGQAGPALRAGDRGRDRGDARLASSASSRTRRRCASSRVPPRVLARELDELEGVREGVGREGARVPRLRRGRARCARRSRSSSPRTELGGVPARAGHDACSSAPTRRRWSSRVLGALRLQLATASSG